MGHRDTSLWPTRYLSRKSGLPASPTRQRPPRQRLRSNGRFGNHHLFGISRILFLQDSCVFRFRPVPQRGYRSLDESEAAACNEDRPSLRLAPESPQVESCRFCASPWLSITNQTPHPFFAAAWRSQQVGTWAKDTPDLRPGL